MQESWAWHYLMRSFKGSLKGDPLKGSLRGSVKGVPVTPLNPRGATVEGKRLPERIWHWGDDEELHLAWANIRFFFLRALFRLQSLLRKSPRETGSFGTNPLFGRA